jgi:Fur family ferric uptake transcriptional regulator
MPSQIERLCTERRIKLTENRKIIARVISDSVDHPDVEEVFKRAAKINPSIGIATVYRAVKLFEELGVISRHDFGGRGRARYEKLEGDDHHDHLVDISTDEVHEFFSEELEKLQEKIAREKGFEIVGHRMELYCRPLKSSVVSRKS